MERTFYILGVFPRQFLPYRIYFAYRTLRLPFSTELLALAPLGLSSRPVVLVDVLVAVSSLSCAILSRKYKRLAIKFWNISFGDCVVWTNMSFTSFRDRSVCVNISLTWSVLTGVRHAVVVNGVVVVGVVVDVGPVLPGEWNSKRTLGSSYGCTFLCISSTRGSTHIGLCLTKPSCTSLTTTLDKVVDGTNMSCTVFGKWIGVG